MTKKKSLFKNISLIFICLMLVIFPCLSFFNAKSNNVAYADSVDTGYSFHSSDTYSINIWDKNWVSNQTFTGLFNGNCKYVDNQLSVQPIMYLVNTSSSSPTMNYVLCSYYRYTTKSDYNFYVNTNISNYVNLTRGVPYKVITTSNVNEYNSGHVTSFYFYSTSEFNCNVYKIELGLRDTNEWETNVSSSRKYFYIKYFDVNDNYCVYDFIVTRDFWFNTRIYYLVSSDNLTDNQLYNHGYQQGLLDNQTDTYNAGYNAGHVVGYDNGYAEGVASANDYTFLSLFGAVLDAPVKTITGLLNFNLLGVNLLGFATGLFSLALLLFIIKLFLGGK